MSEDNDKQRPRYCLICDEEMEWDEDDERFYCSNLKCNDGWYEEDESDE